MSIEKIAAFKVGDRVEDTYRCEVTGWNYPRYGTVSEVMIGRHRDIETNSAPTDTLYTVDWDDGEAVTTIWWEHELRDIPETPS